jgi:phosphatidylglycerophosphate synthase
MSINWKKEILTIPNLLTVFRLALIPVYISIYLNADKPSDYYLAAGILALSCSTDMIDGFIASKNITIKSVKTRDLGFRYSDHNPVVLTAALN